MADNRVEHLSARWAEQIELAPGLHVPSAVSVEVTNWRGYNLRLEFALTSGRYRCSELHMFQRDNGSEVTGEALRDVPVAGILQRAIQQSTAFPSIPDATKQLEGRAPSKETLLSVSQVYMFALVIGLAPKQAVAAQFEISTATASRWIARARDAKLLDS